MTLFHTHRGELFGVREPRNGGRSLLARASRKVVATLKMMHRAIVTAKLRRLRSELMFHRTEHAQPELDAYAQPNLDAAKIPQRPLVLGDKWDF